MEPFHSKHAFQDAYWCCHCVKSHFSTYSQHFEFECQSGFQGFFMFRNNTFVHRKYFIPVRAYHWTIWEGKISLQERWLVIAFSISCISIIPHGTWAIEHLLNYCHFQGKKNPSTRVTLVIFFEIRKMYKNIALGKYLGCRIMSFWFDRQAVTIN